MEFSEDVQKMLAEKLGGKDIYSMSLEELQDFRKDVTDLYDEYNMLNWSSKTLMNAAYGASANVYFYFYNLPLAGDITGECRETTRYMIKKLEHFFHEEIWERKDLQEKFNFKLDESKHDWYRGEHIWRYSDTDSAYTSYGGLFKCMDEESQKRYETDEAKTQFIVDFNVQFLDKQNNEWLEEIYQPRFAKNVHNFELETISKSCIYLKKKKYIKKLVYKDGKFFVDHPKVSGTGIEIVKSTTPKLSREIITELTRILMDDFYKFDSITDFTIYFNDVLQDFKDKFYEADYEEISQSVAIGAYNKYVLDDKVNLKFAPKCPPSVKAIAMFNWMAHKRDEDNKVTLNGKIKYYRVKTSKDVKSATLFGYPSGELPDWHPEMDLRAQWQSTVIDPINRFLEVMNIPLANSDNSIQLPMF